MVSLGEDGQRSGGFYFDGSNEIEDLILPDTSVIGVHTRTPYKSVNYVEPAIIFLLFLLVGFEVELFVLPIKDVLSLDMLYTVLVYSHAGLWFIFALFDCFFRRQHRQSRDFGYLQFYRTTKTIRRIPIVILSSGNALVLVLTRLLSEFCKESSCKGPLKSWHQYLQILCSVEVFVLVIVLFVYLVKVIQFNRAKAMTDLDQEEANSPFHIITHTGPDIGIKCQTFEENVFEKQADAIVHLKERNEHLAKKIHHLWEEIHARGNPDQVL